MNAVHTLRHSLLSGFAATLLACSGSLAQVPAQIAAADEVQIAFIHAQGAQLYECKASAPGQAVWKFREPVAALIQNGQTIGRHYAGPTWELDDGSRITGKVIGRAPGATTSDIPLLKLEVTGRSDKGLISTATTIQRLNTFGGTAEGACEREGVLLSVPYSADYSFLRRKE